MTTKAGLIIGVAPNWAVNPASEYHVIDPLLLGVVTSCAKLIPEQYSKTGLALDPVLAIPEDVTNGAGGIGLIVRFMVLAWLKQIPPTGLLVVNLSDSEAPWVNSCNVGAYNVALGVVVMLGGEKDPAPPDQIPVEADPPIAPVRVTAFVGTPAHTVRSFPALTITEGFIVVETFATAGKHGPNPSGSAVVSLNIRVVPLNDSVIVDVYVLAKLLASSEPVLAKLPDPPDIIDQLAVPAPRILAERFIIVD